MPVIAAARPSRDEPFGPHPPPSVYTLLALDDDHARLGVGGQLRQPVQRPRRRDSLRDPAALDRPPLRERLAAAGQVSPQRGHQRPPVGVPPASLPVDVRARGQRLRLRRDALRWRRLHDLQPGAAVAAAVKSQRVPDRREFAARETVREHLAVLAPVDRQGRVLVVVGRAERLVALTRAPRLAASRFERRDPVS